MQVINLEHAFSLIPQTWSPRIAGEINDVHVKLARLHGAFVWHHHETEDELFLVVKGTLVIHLRDSALTLRPGEFTVIPRGVEHLPVAEEEVHVLLLEPKTTVNTGSAPSDRTVQAEWLPGLREG